MQDLIKLITDNYTTIGAVITGILAWNKDRIKSVFQRKKQDLEIEKSGLNTVQMNLDIYQEMIEDLSSKYKAQINDFKNDLVELRALNDELTSLVQSLTKQLNKYKNTYGEI